MDFLNKFLAELLAKFKASSPTVFMIIVTILSALKELIDAQIIPIPEQISEWVLWFIALFVGTRTTRFIENK